MRQGLLKISVLQISSDYYKQKPYKLSISSQSTTQTHTIQKPQTPQTFGYNNYQYFPITKTLELKIFQNEQIDAKYGYFLIPMDQLYELPGKNHVIDVYCGWKKKKQDKFSDEKEVAAVVRVSVVYEQHVKGLIRLHIKEALLQRDTEFIGKMDPYLVCKIQTKQANQTKQIKTNVLNEAGKTPKWNQYFTVDLQNIPNKISFEVWDEDLTSDDIVGTAHINPQQDRYFVKGEVDRKIVIWHEGKKAGVLFLSTEFDVVR